MMTLNKHLEAAIIPFKAPFLGILLILITVSLLNTPILVTLWRHSFDDGTYSHAYLIPFISLYLFYVLQKSGKLTFRKQFSFPATIIFSLSCFALFITSNAQLSLGYWCSLIAVLVSGINMLYQFNKYIAVPSLYLIFILPAWGMFTDILQTISVKAVTFFMSFTGIPTYVEGNLVTIPAGIFEIADGCSGLRYMIVSLAISSLFSFLYIKNAKKSLGFFSLAIFGALITNWLRITALIMIGEYTNMESSLMEDHNTFGWYLFIPFMIILFWWGNKIADIDLTTAQPKTTQTSNTPNHLSLVVLLAVLALSSTTISSMLIAPPSADSFTSDADFDVKPQIHFYDAVTRHTSPNNNTIELTYFFNGKELDGKPSYYANKLIPKDWQFVSEEISPQWRTIVVSNRKNKAVIQTRYEVDEQFIVLNKELKLTRLIKGVKNIKQSKLHWSFSACKSDCKDQLLNL